MELLAPAGSRKALTAAVQSGAEAVYLGGPQFGARYSAENFTIEEMKTWVDYCHLYGVDVHVTVNTLVKEKEIESLKEYLKQLNKIGVDALIVQDMGAVEIIKKTVPDMTLHASTQMTVTSLEGVKYLEDMGFSRVVLARELSEKEIELICKNAKAEIEVFVHGAMCISHSGRCLLSNYFTGRNANMGACTHPCRWKYYVMEESRPGEYLPVEENERGTYIFNSKDLCMIEHIPDLLEAGVDSLKIEGRMKTALYVAAVTRTYRRAIDDYKTSPDLFEKNLDYYREEIAKCTYRQFTTGFYYGKTDENSQIYDANTYIKEYTYIGIVQDIDENGWCKIYQRNKFSVGEIIEVMLPDGSNKNLPVLAMEDGDRNSVESAPHPKQEIWINFGEALERGFLLRRKE